MTNRSMIESVKRKSIEKLARANFRPDSDSYRVGEFPLSVADHALREYSDCLDLDDPKFSPERISWMSKDVMYGAIALFSYFRLNHPSHPGQMHPSIQYLDLRGVAKEFEEHPLVYYLHSLMEVVYSRPISWTDQKFHAMLAVMVRKRDEVWSRMHPGTECSSTTWKDRDYRKKYASDRALECLPTMLNHFGCGTEEQRYEVSEKLTTTLHNYPMIDGNGLPVKPYFKHLKEKLLETE